MVFQRILGIATTGRGSYLITDELQDVVQQSGILTGLAHIFLHHTSASLMLCENADMEVRSDLEHFMSHLVPDGDPLFAHTDEGPDDMPAHVRTILTHSDLTLPVTAGLCGLGTWQGIFLWEHRKQGHYRQITVTVTG